MAAISATPLTASSYASVAPTAAAAIPAYSEIRNSNYLRRIPEKQWNEILAKIAQLDHTLTDDELVAFKKGQWEAPIFQDEHWPYFAFHAHLEGKIVQETLNRLFLYDMSRKQVERSQREGNPTAEFKAYQLCDENEKVDPAAEMVLRESLRSQYDDYQFVNVISYLRKLRSVETQFFFIQMKLDPNMKKYIRDGLFSTQKRVQLVYSPNFFREILRAKFGKDMMYPDPVIGFSPFEELLDPKKRIMFIPCSLVPCATLPEGEKNLHETSPFYENVHNEYRAPLTVYHHDMVHLHSESANIHRPIWIAFAKHVKDSVTHALYETLLDRDFNLYYPNAAPDIPEYPRIWQPQSNYRKFWETTNDLIEGHVFTQSDERKKPLSDLIIDFHIKNNHLFRNQGISIADFPFSTALSFRGGYLEGVRQGFADAMTPISDENLTPLKKTDWEHPLFSDPNWISLAQRAFEHKQIDEQTFKKLLQYHESENSA